MLTPNQIKYLSTIPASKKVDIQPWNSKTHEVAEHLINQIQKVNPELKVLYVGASALKLPGINDIDLIILSEPKDYSKYEPTLTKILGRDAETGTTGQSRFWKDITVAGFPLDISMSYPEHPHLKEQLDLFNLLKNDITLWNEYKKLKEDSNGLSYRDYQARKYEFYNRILE